MQAFPGQFQPAGQTATCRVCWVYSFWCVERPARVAQLNRSRCGGARLSGKHMSSIPTLLPRRCVGICLITTESSMQTMTFMLPPQTLHISMSILNTRFKLCAELIAAWLATGASSGPGTLALLARPRRADVTSAVLTVGREHTVIACQIHP